MTQDYFEEYAEVTMHKFKTHIAYYIRLLETGLCKAVVVKRRDKPVGLFMPYPKDTDEKKEGGAD